MATTANTMASAAEGAFRLSRETAGKLFQKAWNDAEHV